MDSLFGLIFLFLPCTPVFTQLPRPALPRLPSPGLSGSGKSTVACTLEHLLHERGHFTSLLDGDNIRHGLNKDLGFRCGRDGGKKRPGWGIAQPSLAPSAVACTQESAGAGAASLLHSSRSPLLPACPKMQP